MKKLSSEKGFTTVDIGIAMVVVIIFVTIMASLFNSVYLSSTEAKRTAVALNYGVDIFEEIGLTDVTDVKAKDIFENLKVKLNLKQTPGPSSNNEVAYYETVKGNYKFKLEVESPYLDGTVKTVKLTITYPVSNKNAEETIELQRIKTTEIPL